MRRLIAVLLSGAALTGCTLEPAYVRPTPAAPQTWPVGALCLSCAAAIVQRAALPSVSYRDVFKDPHLQAVIERAIANNRDLQIAMANVTIARSQYRVQRAQLLPKIDAIAGGQRGPRAARRSCSPTGHVRLRARPAAPITPTSASAVTNSTSSAGSGP